MFSPPRFFHLALLGLTLPALLLVGCGPRRSGPSGTTTPPPANVVRIALVDRPTTFDPAMVQDGTTIDVLQQMYEGLVQWTTENTVAGALAERWDVSKDGLTYTFHLRNGVKFQDGKPVTAQDVYASLRRALDPALKSPIAINYLGDIVGAKELNDGKTKELAGVKVVNPQTVAITIGKPKAYWIYTLTYPTGYVLSPSVTGRPPSELSDADVQAGVGTGPFQLASYAKDSKVTLKANPNYWGGAPKISGIERPIVVQANTRHDLYVNGQLDLLTQTAGDLETDQKDPVLAEQVKTFPRASTFYIGLNQRIFAPFKDVRVRQALAYATDKEKIARIALHGQVRVAQDILPEGIPGFDPNFKGLPYDVQKARALLSQAGFPGGKDFPAVTMSYRQSYPELARTVDIIRQMWKENLGIEVKPGQSEYGVLLSRIDQNTVIPCYHIRWAADYLDPQNYYSVLLRTGSVENHSGYSNSRFDGLCDQADVSQNPALRQKLYRQAARIAAADVPLIPLYYQRDIELVKPYVRDLDDSLMGHLPLKHLALAQ